MAQLAKTSLLSGKVGIVTGATRGIGAAIARNLASKGCSIVLGYTSESSKRLAKDLAKEFRESYDVTAVPAQGDIGNEGDAFRVVEIAKENFTDTKNGKCQIDIVVNNAGVADLKPLGKINVDDFNKVYSTNVLGPIFLLQACLPYLPTDRSGRIVNVSSVGSALGLREQTVYAGSKGALEAMTRVWARELAERATVNSVNPGPVLSDIFIRCSNDIKMLLGQWNQVSPLATVRPQDEEAVRQWEKFGGRPAHAAEVAGVVAMLCSPDGGWTTGSVISANGGMRFSY
ncbi:uncharacterized protein A1O5_11307 [Cladophialophora psammophila CBS 110553]|uniref:Ketoreductase domain-containing protein n=1 Tax=Cladophialophora psammophila CBS 110553 TaxID=1182543 RepID=W9WG26_9EURO|nr:uncharacterized protein A1O5_11307 [Cladophialophora psammophila CBS 110553]EXJ63546.1 hypothetical protein A1O5_11307 [Cladophialophora psammophila CBS 110553]